MMKVVVGILTVLSVVMGQTCFEGPGGASMTETKAGGHNIQVLDDLQDFLHTEYLGDQGNHWETCSCLFWHSCSQWGI